MKVYNNYASKLIIFKVSRHFFQSNLFTYYLFPMNKCDIHFFYRNTLYRSSRPEVFCKKVVLRNFTKFTGKHLGRGLFFNKVAGLRPAALLKKNFEKFLRTPFYIEHLW